MDKFENARQEAWLNAISNRPNPFASLIATAKVMMSENYARFRHSRLRYLVYLAALLGVSYLLDK